MATSAKVLADSISPEGVRLTTLECVYPRIVHAEMMTHRMFSRNAASSRAIPVQKMISAVQDDPYVPTSWGKNQKGMQAEQDLTPEEAYTARQRWLWARDSAVSHATALLELGLHKQLVNRLLEPFHWYTCIITATEWANFFNLRCNPMAHPEIKRAAELMLYAMQSSAPRLLNYGQWHTPLVGEDEAAQILEEEELRGWTTCDHNMIARVSVGRCARVSYLTHDGKRDPVEDVKLADRLLEAGHMSPFEHVARPMTLEEAAEFDHTIGFCGNLRGWVQYRKTIPHEADVLGAR